MTTSPPPKRAKISLFENTDPISTVSNHLADAYLLYTSGAESLQPSLSPPDSGIASHPIFCESMKPKLVETLTNPISIPIVTAPSNGTSHMLLPNGSISPLSPSHTSTSAFLPSLNASSNFGSQQLMNTQSNAVSPIQNDSRSQPLLVRQIRLPSNFQLTSISNAVQPLAPKFMPSNAQLAPRLAPVTFSASSGPSSSAIPKSPPAPPLPNPLPMADPDKSAVQLTSEVFEFASSLFSELGDLIAIASEHLPDTQQQLALVRGPGRPRGANTGPDDALYPDTPGPAPPPPPPPLHTAPSTNGNTNPNSSMWYPPPSAMNGDPPNTPTRGRGRGRGGRPPNSARWNPEELDLLEVRSYLIDLPRNIVL